MSREVFKINEGYGQVKVAVGKYLNMDYSDTIEIPATLLNPFLRAIEPMEEMLYITLVNNSNKTKPIYHINKVIVGGIDCSVKEYWELELKENCGFKEAK